MKKIYKSILGLALLFIGGKNNAQVSAYSFTQLSGIYSPIPISGPSTTAIAVGNQDDNIYTNIPIGFNFTFNNTNYTSIALNVNGWICMGTASPFSSYNPISSGSANDVVAFMGRDLQMAPAQSCTTTLGSNVIALTYTPATINAFSVGDTLFGNGIPLNTTVTAIAANSMTMSANATAAGTNVYAKGSISYNLAGIAPNRIFTIQWRRVGRYNQTSTGLDDYGNAQIKLHETTNIVEVIYGKYGTNNSFLSTAEVGLRGATNLDFNNRSVSSGGSFATSTSGTVNTANAAYDNTTTIPNGQIYRWTPPPICVGAPSANSSLASQTLICSGGSSNLSLANSYTVGGLAYQWGSSTVSAGPYVAIPNATISTYAASNITVTTWYRCIVTCTNGPSSTTATPVSVNIAVTTTNSVAYAEGFEGISVNNQLPNCSWAASNLPAICQTYTATTNSFNQIPHTGAKFASFHYGTDPAGDFFYTNGIQLNVGTTYSASSYYITDGATGWTEFSLLYGTTQSTTGLVSIASVTGNLVNTTYSQLANTFTVPSSGIYYIAVKAIGNFVPWYLTWDDLTITAPPVCPGAPASNTAVASSTLVCSGGSSNLSLVNTYSTVGLAYQWFSAPASAGPYSAISTATQSIYAATNITVSTWYQSVITCITGPASTTSTPVQVNLFGTPVYATVPFLENFDNTWQNRCDVRNVPVANNWDSNPTTGNQSWRREDDGASALWTAQTTGTVTPLAGAGCADFHSYYAPNGSTGDLNLYVNLNLSSTYTMSFYYTNISGTDSMEVFLSTDGGVTFTKKSGYTIDALWNKKTVLLSAVNSSSCVIKFKATGDFGNDDIGIDSLQIISPCVVPTVTLTASQSTICSGSSVNLIASGATTYTWNTNATTSSISVTPSVTTSYTVTSENMPGCPSTNTISVSVKTSPTVSIVSSHSVMCLGQTTSLTASGALTYLWNVSSTNTTILVSPPITTTYTVTGTAVNGCTNSVAVTLSVTACTGIVSKTGANNGILVYPNPSAGEFTIELNNGSIKNIQVMDLTGRIILSGSSANDKFNFNINSVANGIYYVRIQSDNIVDVIKIIKQ